MSKYYEITAAQALGIGYVKIDDIMALDCTVGKLKNGNHIVNEDIVKYLKKQGIKIKKLDDAIKLKTVKSIINSDIDKTGWE